jgi:molybdopterin-guanine dinucleotide biosynthesis protein A
VNNRITCCIPLTRGQAVIIKKTTPSFGSALILAGGKGSRMGYDKKMLSLNGTNVMSILITRLQAIFSEIIVSSNNKFEHDNVLVLHDDIGAGPLAGIYQGLRHCKSEYLYIVACDMPFISSDYINFIKNRVENGGGAQRYDVCAAQKDDGFLEPFNALYSKNCTDIIRAALESGDYKILPVLKKLRICVIQSGDIKKIHAGTHSSLFFNINYKADLQEAEELLRNSGIVSIIET